MDKDQEKTGPENQPRQTKETIFAFAAAGNALDTYNAGLLADVIPIGIPAASQEKPAEKPRVSKFRVISNP